MAFNHVDFKYQTLRSLPVLTIITIIIVIRNSIMNLSNTVVSSAEAARVLGIHPLSIQKLIYSGAIGSFHYFVPHFLDANFQFFTENLFVWYLDSKMWENAKDPNFDIFSPSYRVPKIEKIVTQYDRFSSLDRLFLFSTHFFCLILGPWQTFSVLDRLFLFNSLFFNVSTPKWSPSWGEFESGV